jgi:hypothetical protein
VADVAVLSLQKGSSAFTDMVNTQAGRHQKLVAELTLKDGKIVYDLNGLESWRGMRRKATSRRTALDILAAAGSQSHDAVRDACIGLAF